MRVVEEVRRQVWLFTTPEQLRKLADDLEKDWFAGDDIADWGKDTPNRIIDGGDFTLKICCSQDLMPQRTRRAKETHRPDPASTVGVR